mmetsp:Transcript_74528/g.212489  ORF Transcript_74528/g.212489 Transcript_74528/m.212489 type:complete len:283 (-) Transcript_74528:35-883(-)
MGNMHVQPCPPPPSHTTARSGTTRAKGGHGLAWGACTGNYLKSKGRVGRRGCVGGGAREGEGAMRPPEHLLLRLALKQNCQTVGLELRGLRTERRPSLLHVLLATEGAATTILLDAALHACLLHVLRHRAERVVARGDALREHVRRRHGLGRGGGDGGGRSGVGHRRCCGRGRQGGDGGGRAGRNIVALRVGGLAVDEPDPPLVALRDDLVRARDRVRGLRGEGVEALALGGLVLLKPVDQARGGARLDLLERGHVGDTVGVRVVRANDDDLVVGLALVDEL